MTLTEALNRAAAMNYTGIGRRTVTGAYPDGSVVTVRRDEQSDHVRVGLSYAVTIRSPLVGEDTRIVTGPEGVKAHLRVRHLSVNIADWIVEPLTARISAAPRE